MGIEHVINGYKLEICSNSPTSAVKAQAGGASRVELCQNLENGGTTPSYGQIKSARALLKIGLHVLIRPRAGDFLYSDLEFEEMMQDVSFCKEVGCDGVVVGILNKEGKVDRKRMKNLVEHALPMTVVFHRAFDHCEDPFQALEDIIKVGCHRLLTSGQQDTALLGCKLIKDLVSVANGRIEVMPGAGVNENNITAILEGTGARSIHSSAKGIVLSDMSYHKDSVQGMDEPIIRTSSDHVIKLVAKLRSL